MSKIIYIIMCIMVLLVIISAVLALKENYIKIKINQLNKEIAISYNEFQSLKAQWTYLNNKQYLQFLTKKYLPNFVPTTIKPNK